MPIVGLSDRRRLPRMMRIRLGERREGRSGGTFPRETDYFVIKAEDGATPEVMSLYAGQPKRLRLMLPFEVDSLDPHSGDELVWNLNNRAYGRNVGLRCKGSGLSTEFPGTAETSDADWARRIAEVTREEAEPMANGRWRVRCLGSDCPKYWRTDDADRRARLVPGHDEDAACRAVAILRAFLLHPQADPRSPDYCRVLGVIEIASGSRNTMIDVRSSFDLMRGFTGGRTAGVPFTLIRKPTQTFGGAGRQLHFPCAVEPAPEEWQRFGNTPLDQVFLSPADRASLRNLEGGAVELDSVRDLVPAASTPRLVGPERSGPRMSAPRSAVDGGDDPCGPAVGAAVEEAGLEQEDDTGATRQLVAAERDELKALLGEREDPDDSASPWTAATMRRLQELAAEAHAQFGTDPAGRPVSSLQVRHARWMRSRIAGDTGTSRATAEEAAS